MVFNRISSNDLSYICILMAMVLAASFVALNLAGINRDLRNPVNILLISWIASFSLIGINIVDYVGSSLQSMLYLLSCICVMSLGIAIGSIIKLKKNRTYNFNISYAIVFGWISLIFAVAYQQQKFGLANLILHPGQVRALDNGGTGLLGILVFSPTICWILIVIYYFGESRRKAGTRPGIFTILFLVSTVAYMLILPERTPIVNTLSWSAISLWMTLRRPQNISFKSVTRAALPITILGIVFTAFFVAVSQRTGKVNYLSTVSFAIKDKDNVSASLIDPYTYLTGSVSALGMAFEDEATKGDYLRIAPERTALFPRRVFQIFFDDGGEKLTPNARFVNIPFLFNTYSMFYDPLHDYGVIGCLIYVALLGVIVGIIFSNARKNDDVLSIFAYGWAGSALLFGIMTDKFADVYYWYSIILAIILVSLGRFKGRV